MEPRHFARDVSVSRQQALDWPLGEDMQAIEGGVQSGVYCAAGVASGDLDTPDEIHQLPTTVAATSFGCPPIPIHTLLLPQLAFTSLSVLWDEAPPPRVARIS